MVNDALSARQTAANNATPLAQQVLDAYDKVDKETAKQVWKELADFILGWILQDVKNEENPFIMIYIDKKEKGEDPSKYDDIFSKYGFKRTEKGGYYARMKQNEWNDILQKYEWLPKAVKIKTAVARKQEDEK